MLDKVEMGVPEVTDKLRRVGAQLHGQVPGGCGKKGLAHEAHGDQSAHIAAVSDMVCYHVHELLHAREAVGCRRHGGREAEGDG
jgi:hypothetical protein